MADLSRFQAGDRLYRKTLGGYSTYTVTGIGFGNCITVTHDSSGANFQLTARDLIKYNAVTPEMENDIRLQDIRNMFCKHLDMLSINVNTLSTEDMLNIIGITKKYIGE